MRQKIDDELPELTHTLIGLLWPHYLRPVPSMTIAEFRPKPDVATPQLIEKGVELYSRPVDGTVCKFKTCYDVELVPLYLEEAAFESTVSIPEEMLRFSWLPIGRIR